MSNDLIVRFGNDESVTGYIKGKYLLPDRIRLINLGPDKVKFSDIDTVFPRVTVSKDSIYTDDISFKLNLIPITRVKNLNNRSTQAYMFDSSILLGVFNSLNVDIIPEYPVVNTKRGGKSFYLMDYFIPSKSICIELDSSVHNLYNDKIRDEYLNSLGIRVIRIWNFLSNPSVQLESLKNEIFKSPDKEFKIDYSEYIDRCNKALKECSNKLTNEPSNLYSILSDEDKLHEIYLKLRSIGITPRKAEKLSVLCSYDDNILKSILGEIESYSLKISLDSLFYILPMKLKESARYDCILKSLRKFNVNIDIVNSVEIMNKAGELVDSSVIYDE